MRRDADAGVGQRRRRSAHGAEAGAARRRRTDILDLDRFRLRSCRPTDQEIVDLQFGVCLVLSSKVTPADFHELEAWKHRLRDQVIIAVRSASPTTSPTPTCAGCNG